MNLDGSFPYPYTAEVGDLATVNDLNAGPSYQSPARVEAWAAHTSGVLVNQQMLDVPNSVPLSNDGTWSTGAVSMPGYLSHSNSSDGSDAVHSVPMLRSNGSIFNTHATDMTGLSESGSSSGFQNFQGLGVDMLPSHGGNPTMDNAYPLDGRPYPQDDIPISFSHNDQTLYSGDIGHTLDLSHGFLSEQDPGNVRSGSMDGVYYPGLSGITVDSSVSSSLSSHNPSTPVSLSQEQWEESVSQPHFVNGINQFSSSSFPYNDVQRFGANEFRSSLVVNRHRSTVRPVQGTQRSSLPGQWTQPPSDTTGQLYGSPISTFASSRRSSEGEPLSARRHRLYQVKPRKDGHYKCVFVDDDKMCDHEPFKLKCNYDKHLDSHLKPYRCKQSGCAENPFSSTACLLRHEREAHGMHNHKEVLCRVSTCERSHRGRGFPRKWNAHDHMKRVHRYTASEDSTSNSGEPSSPSASSMDYTFSEAPTLVNATNKKRYPEMREHSGNSSAKKSKAAAQFAKEFGPVKRYPPQVSRGQGLKENDAPLGRRCAQKSSPVSNWDLFPRQQYTAF